MMLRPSGCRSVGTDTPLWRIICSQLERGHGILEQTDELT
jgi:hypothetical protein